MITWAQKEFIKIFRHRNNFFALFTSPRHAPSLLFPVFSVSPVTNSSPFTFTSATPLSPPILAGPCFSHNNSHLDQQHHCFTPINTPQKDRIWKNNTYLFQHDKKTERKFSLQRLPRVTSSCLFLRVAPNCWTFQSWNWEYLTQSYWLSSAFSHWRQNQHGEEAARLENSQHRHFRFCPVHLLSPIQLPHPLITLLFQPHPFSTPHPIPPSSFHHLKPQAPPITDGPQAYFFSTCYNPNPLP